MSGVWDDNVAYRYDTVCYYYFFGGKVGIGSLGESREQC